MGNAASDVNSIYQQLLDKINSMFQQGTTGFGEGSQPNLNLIGWQFPSESWLDDINGLVSEYDSAYDNFTSVVNETVNMFHLRLQAICLHTIKITRLLRQVLLTVQETLLFLQK